MLRASTVNTAIHRDCTDAFEQTHRETASRVGSALSVLTLAHSMTFTLKQQFWVNLVTLVMRHFILGSILQAIEFFHHEMQFKKQTTWKSCSKSHNILVSAVCSLSFQSIMSLRYWMKNTTKRNELRTEFGRKRGWKVLWFLFDYTLGLSVSQVLDSMLKAILSKPLFFMKPSLHQDTSFCFSIAFPGCLVYLYYVWVW